MQKKKLLLFGGSGLLGSRIIQLLSQKYIIIAPPRRIVDLARKDDVEKYMKDTAVDIVVYAAGITNVDEAEREKEYAMRVNKQALSWILKYLSHIGVPLIYFSTDAVFKGDKAEKPYTETDSVSPVNYYGLTKAKGEELVISSSKNNLIIRLITLYTDFYPKKLDFARKILIDISENNPCFGIVDQYCNPTYVDNVVHGLSAAIDKKISGLLHFGATDFLTNYDFARAVVTRFGFNAERILPIDLSTFFKGKIAKRAQYTWLDTAKSQRLLGPSILHTNEQSIDFFLQKLYQEEYLLTLFGSFTTLALMIERRMSHPSLNELT